jgi:hypothetical protein
MSPPNLWYLPPAFFSAGGPWGRRAPGLLCALSLNERDMLRHDSGVVRREKVHACLAPVFVSEMEDHVAWVARTFRCGAWPLDGCVGWMER